MEIFGLGGLIRLGLIPIIGAEYLASVPPDHANTALFRLATTDVKVFRDIFKRRQYDLPLQFQPNIIVDCGANIGLSAIYFALRFPQATIIAIEPEQSNFAILEKNAQLYPQIIPIRAALWCNNGFVSLHDPGAGHWAMRVDQSKGNVEAVSLRTVMDRFKITRIGLLKVDVEGAECELFKDASQWIDQVDVICTELHERFRVGCSDIYEAATRSFPVRWQQGELSCFSRNGLTVVK